jgi:hypothetical protein
MAEPVVMLHTATRVLGLASFALLVLTTTSESRDDAGAAVRFGVRGDNTVYPNVCRYEFSSVPPVMTVFDFTVTEGGRTCFDGSRGILFVPRTGTDCRRLDQMGAAAPASLDHDEAARAYLGCSAIAMPTSGGAQLILYRPNPAHPRSAETFPDFVLDVGALAGNDMLPVTSMVPGGEVLCLEAPDGRAVVRRIAEAGIASPDEFRIEHRIGSCREAMTP